MDDGGTWGSVALCFGSGVVTVLHPCPLTTNVAALSLLTAWADRLRRALIVGGAFVAGYAGAYLLLGIVIGLVGARIEAAVGDLNHLMAFVVGPGLILAGMLQTGLLRLPEGRRGQVLKARLQQRDWRPAGAAGLGLLLALAFCPASAGLFFGVLLPGILASGSVLLLPLAFGLGAALPLAVVVLLVAGGRQRLAAEGAWPRRIGLAAGILLIGIGIYRCVVDLLL